MARQKHHGRRAPHRKLLTSWRPGSKEEYQEGVRAKMHPLKIYLK
jgi:hypothetical protein